MRRLQFLTLLLVGAFATPVQAESAQDPRAPVSGATVVETAPAAEAAPPDPAPEAAPEEPPYQPVAPEYADFIPSGDFTTAGDTPPDLELVKRLFVLGFAEQCAWAISGGMGGIGPEVYDLSYRDEYAEASAPDRTFKLYQFNCDAGAYNFNSVWMTWDSVYGVRPLSFATPDFSVAYENGDFDGKVTGITYNGMTSYNILTNSSFDPATATIGSFAKWRGIGDASDGGAWMQKGENFVLESFEVDASYDEQENPFLIVADGRPLDTPVPVPVDDGANDAADGESADAPPGT